MKPLMAKILIVLCLFSFTPAKEFMKIPMLLIHYIEHLEEMPEMTIGQFFDLHYNHGVVFDDDYAKDMKLPFKVIDFSHLPVFVLNEFKLCEITFNVSSFFVKNKVNTSYRFCLSDAILSGVFHPPRF